MSKELAKLAAKYWIHDLDANLDQRKVACMLIDRNATAILREHSRIEAANKCANERYFRDVEALKAKVLTISDDLPDRLSKEHSEDFMTELRYIFSEIVEQIG